MSTPSIKPGDRVKFMGSHRWWLARAAARDDRFLILTSAGGRIGVFYTIIDWHKLVRGPMNVIGGGLSIETLRGPDVAIDAAVARLEEGPDEGGTGTQDDPYRSLAWEVSQRRGVRLEINRVIPAEDLYPPVPTGAGV